MKPSSLVDTRVIYCGDNIDQLALTRAELIRAMLDAVEAANPRVDGDGPALTLTRPLGRIELKSAE